MRCRILSTIGPHLWTFTAAYRPLVRCAALCLLIYVAFGGIADEWAAAVVILVLALYLGASRP